MSSSEAPLTDEELRDLRVLLSHRRIDPALKGQRDAADAAILAEQTRIRDAAAVLEAGVSAARAKLEGDLKGLPDLSDPDARRAAYDALVAAYDAEVAKVHTSQEWIDLHRDGEASVALLIDARKALG